MTLGAFHRLVFQRAWHIAFDRARRFGFWVAPVGAVLLLLAWSFLPQSWPPFLAKLLPYAAILSLAFLLSNLLWMLLFRAPYELYREKAEALDAAILVKMAATLRAEIRNKLAVFLEEGQGLTEHLERWHSGPTTHDDILQENDIAIGLKAIQWIADVNSYLGTELGAEHRSRFAANAYFPKADTIGVERNRLLPGLRDRCANLLAIIRDSTPDRP